MKNFEFFRLSALKITAMQDAIGDTYNSGAGQQQVNGWSTFIAFDPAPVADTTAPSTLALLSQLPEFAMGNGMNKAVISLGPQDLYLATPVKWYHTATTGSPNASDLSAGALYVGLDLDLAVGAGTADVFVQIEGVLELKAPVDSSDA
jgi:hypothetical protein